MAVYDDDIPVTDATDGEPVGTPTHAQPDVASIVAQTTEALFAKLAPLLQRPEPQQQAQPSKPGDPLLDAIKERLGIDDDEEARRYAKAQAYRLIQDDYGDDPNIRRAIDQRSEGARPIESMSALRKEMREYMRKIDGRFSEQEQARKREEEAAAYKRMAVEGALADKFPNLFRKGKPSQAALKIFDRFHDVEQLRAALEVAEEIAAEQQPRRPNIPAGSGRATQAPKPTKFYDGSEYDAQVRKIFEEMN